MKIIANSGREKFLVEVTESELAHICYGKHYASRMDFKIGDDLKVFELFNRLDRLNSSQGQLDSMAANLRALATLLEATEPIVRGLVNEESGEVGSE